MTKALTVAASVLTVVAVVLAQVVPPLVVAVGLVGLALGLGLVWWLTDVPIGIERAPKGTGEPLPPSARH